MPTEDDFLRAIRAAPRDDAPYLQFADWLAERGDPRAEVYRRPRLTNSAGMRLVLLPPGTFLMGSPESEPYRSADEGPRREVTLTRPFWLGVTPVTQAQYEAVTGGNPSAFAPGGAAAGRVRGLDTADFPVEGVTWGEADAFCRALSALPDERAAGRVYRLPTEAGWEYACRGGGSEYQRFHTGATLTSARANFDGRKPPPGSPRGPYLGRPCPVGSYPPNGFGLCDLHGNVAEWCADWYAEDYYRTGPAVDPPGPPPRDPPVPRHPYDDDAYAPSGRTRVTRGGSWRSTALGCRSAFRDWADPASRVAHVGFRAALGVAPPGIH